MSIRTAQLSLVLFAALCYSRLAPGAEPAGQQPAMPRVLDEAASDSEEQTFRDPFADEQKREVKVSDPLQPMNRAFFKFNDKLYFWVLKPAATGYNKVAPEPFRQSIKRAFVNLRFPVRFVNNLLQGKLKGAGVETVRFLVNSTVGIGGLFDPALDEWEFEAYPEDLDQTFGFYRLPPGLYLHWPVFGPSSVRGTVGTVGDSFLSPLSYIDPAYVSPAARAYDTVNSTSLRLGEYEGFKEAAFDPYISLRNAYFENRQSLVEK